MTDMEELWLIEDYIIDNGNWSIPGTAFTAYYMLLIIRLGYKLGWS